MNIKPKGIWVRSYSANYNNFNYMQTIYEDRNEKAAFASKDHLILFFGNYCFYL